MSFWKRKKTYKEEPQPSDSFDSMDVNHDGVVTRKEMEAYVNTQLIEKDKQLNQLRDAYDDLYAKHSKVLEQIAKDNSMETVRQSNISGEAVQKFVEELLTDPNVNIYGFPDRIESAVYCNVIRMILGAMEKLFNNVSVEFIGHKITINMVPDDPMEGEDLSIV